MSIISSRKKYTGAITGTGTGIGVTGAGTAVIGAGTAVIGDGIAITGIVIGGEAIGDLIATAGTSYSIPVSIRI